MKNIFDTLNKQFSSFIEQTEDFILKEMEPFTRLMMQYECAILEIETKLKVLNREFSLNGASNPIESISTRLKNPRSLKRKLERYNLSQDIDSIRNHIHDVAGVRVVCSFKNDVYKLVEAIKNQDDITVIKEKDYIKNYKENGYRSYHLIVSVPIFMAESKEEMTVEIQFRTIAMDFWASLEHKLRYKKNLSKEKEEQIEKRLLMCAEISSRLDSQMQKVKEMIEEDSSLESENE